MVSLYMIYFSLLSVVGYFYECIAMTFWAGKWDNRGFLFGPAIPIYGTGALLGTLLFTYIYTDYTPLTVFLVSMAASAVLEYVVHYVLEKIFHAYWWDYSSSPLNLNGRICLPASIGFGIAGLLIVYGINPVLLPLLGKIDIELRQFLAMLCVMLFSADTTLTICVLSSFIRRVENLDSHFNDYMDSFVGNFLDESRGINNHFYSAVDRITDAGKKLTDNRAFDLMGVLYGRIISRVKRFTGRSASALNKRLSRIKKRFKRNKDE